MTHSIAEIYKTFSLIDQGVITNAHFSGTSVVMLNGNLYDTLIDKIEELERKLAELEKYPELRRRY